MDSRVPSVRGADLFDEPRGGLHGALRGSGVGISRFTVGVTPSR
ncbi:hypothetical protein ABH922_004766 [Rhodococcus sp. 27YEA15]